MAFEVAKVRSCYPALADGYAYLDGAAGTQVPRSVIDAISGPYEAGIGHSAGAFPANEPADRVTAARTAALGYPGWGGPQWVELGTEPDTLTQLLRGAA